MVDIVPRRVAAAIKQRETSVLVVARDIECRQQTLNEIIRSEGPRRCRRSIRDGLARRLDYPVEWLAGETNWTPGAPWGGVSGGAASSYLMDESFTIYRRGADGQPELDDPDQHLPTFQLVGRSLSLKIAAAWQRDCEAGVDGAREVWEACAHRGQTSEDGAEVAEDGAHVWAMVLRCLALPWWERLISGDRRPKWRILPSKPSPDEDPGMTQQRALGEAELAQNERFAAAMGGVLEGVLEPWFQGAWPVDYAALKDVHDWLRGGLLTPSRRARLDAMFAEIDARVPDTNRD